MKFTTLKVAALTAALLGLSQFAVADNDDKGDNSRTLSVSQAADKIKGEEGKAKRSAKQSIDKAVALFQEGKISAATAMAALVDVLGADSAAIGTAFSALVAAGADESTVQAAAISAGVDPAKVTSASAAGGDNTGGNEGSTGATGGNSFSVPPASNVPVGGSTRPYA